MLTHLLSKRCSIYRRDLLNFYADFLRLLTSSVRLKVLSRRLSYQSWFSCSWFSSDFWIITLDFCRIVCWNGTLKNNLIFYVESLYEDHLWSKRVSYLSFLFILRHRCWRLLILYALLLIFYFRSFWLLISNNIGLLLIFSPFNSSHKLSCLLVPSNYIFNIWVKISLFSLLCV